MLMGAPLKTPALSGGTGAVAGKAHVESGRREAVDGVFSGSGRHLEAKLGRARADGVEADERATAAVFLRREEEAARRDEIEPLRRRRDEDENGGAGERQRLLPRPQRIDLRLRAGDEAALKIEPELRQPLRIRSAMLGEGALGRGEKNQAVVRRKASSPLSRLRERLGVRGRAQRTAHVSTPPRPARLRPATLSRRRERV